jgi:hypothetical protein
VSPRTRFRGPAIEAWEAQRAQQFGTAPLDAPLETWPEHFPTVEQSRLLLRNGVREPVITELTRIGTVEGFGSMMRYLPLPDVGAVFVEDVRGTATDHIRKGLFEAHARDEAGWEDEAGHDSMWFAARDIAFEHPTTEDQRELMLGRMGITPPGSGGSNLATIYEQAKANRVLPADLQFKLEMMLNRMISLLFIEISAFHAFAWAEDLLADDELVAGEGEAARLVSYIRADETPHVGYLTVALSEMRDRTWQGTTGARYEGTEMISTLWDKALEDSRRLRRGQFLRAMVGELERSIATHPDGDDLLEEFWSLGTLRREDDGSFVERLANGDEVHVP